MQFILSIKLILEAKIVITNGGSVGFKLYTTYIKYSHWVKIKDQYREPEKW